MELRPYVRASHEFLLASDDFFDIKTYKRACGCIAISGKNNTVVTQGMKHYIIFAQNF